MQMVPDFASVFYAVCMTCCKYLFLLFYSLVLTTKLYCDNDNILNIRDYFNRINDVYKRI